MSLTDRLTYAVGDIHGRADLLARLLGQIRADRVRRASGQRPLVVFLGDYVDRGAHSREVIDLLIDFANDPTFDSHFLLGNHEDAMIDYLEGRISGAGWSRHGGRETLRSYGVEPPLEPSRTEWSNLRERFRAAVPAAHRAFLDQLELMVRTGKLVFVHAGIRPETGLDAQQRRDLLWIRSEFLEVDRQDGLLVVHGHTPKAEAYGGPGRLCLDSGGYLTGRLTAALFEGDEVALIETHQTEPRPFSVHVGQS